MRQFATIRSRGGALQTKASRFLVAVFLLITAMPGEAVSQEAVLDILPLRPFSFDAAFNQQNFGPKSRLISVKGGFTALRYGPLEVRGIYQYFSLHNPIITTDQHLLYANPRWNNFIDVLDFPSSKPISRILRHVLFGPLEHRAVPYVGAMLGGTLPGRGELSPGYLYGGQIGVRFPVAQGFSVDMGLQYMRFEINAQNKSDLAKQWLFTIGLRF
ncbi:MAG: hypothetical protein E8D52_14080 [Nitrospira sp.]|nr:MAG: hypothetical protein E8D52_14080 [Nitrospira sp.]